MKGVVSKFNIKFSLTSMRLKTYQVTRVIQFFIQRNRWHPEVVSNTHFYTSFFLCSNYDWELKLFIDPLIKCFILFINFYKGDFMKKLLGLLMVALIATSCSSIENATSKYKTPESADAGLAPGEKSNYLESSKTPTPEAETKAPAKKKKKAVKK